MPIRFKDLKPGEAAYTWISNKTGRNIHIHAARLREWVMTQDLEIFLTPIDPELAEEFITKNAVSIPRVLQLTLECEAGIRKLDPIIMCKCRPFLTEGPDALLVDGRHRYTIQYLKRERFIPCYVLEVGQWAPFRIVGHPRMTQQELIDIPVNTRNY